MRKKRISWVGIGIMVILGVLVGRLVQIQLIDTESFSSHEINLIEASVKQRSQVLTLDDGRGKFYDRNGKALAHEEVPTLVLFPFLKSMSWPSGKISAIIGVSEQKLLSEIESAKEPFPLKGNDGMPLKLTAEQTKSVNALKIPGVFAVREKFYTKDTPAAQLIGSTIKYSSLKEKRYPDREISNDTRVGYNGLQNTFDEFLLSDGESQLVFHVDAKSGPLFGVDVKYVEPANPLYPVKVITTIDKSIQEVAERIVDAHGIKKGGIVLLNIETSEVLAMVSRPAFSKLEPSGEGSVNYMLRQQTPGSVFKTVTAAAAIDYGLEAQPRTFDCNQGIDQDRPAQRKLGQLTFKDSFAQSCNKTIAEVGQEMANAHPDYLEQYAEKLGVIGLSGWNGEVYHSPVTQLFNEEAGQIWNQNNADQQKKDMKMVAKSAIGQQDVQVSPLAIANMMATIARGGEKRMVKVVNKVEFSNGASVFQFPDKTIGGESLAPYTTMKMQELLRTVVSSEQGTGHSLASLPYEVAGKTGTAQTNVEAKKLNKWFAGYFPYKNPRYALVTVNLDTNENTGNVVPLFADIVKALYTKNHPAGNMTQ